MIEKTAFNKRTREELGLLEQTSDPDWPLEVQRSSIGRINGLLGVATLADSVD